MAAALTLFISDVQVEIATDLADVRDALAVVWNACAQPLLPPVRTARFEARADAGRYLVRGEGTERSVELREDVLPVVEGALYAALPGWHEGRALLHAACVQRGAIALVLAGRSGAGKSSLALEALRRGFDYFSDELTVTDGARLWGVPRAVQFEPTDGARALPPWLRDVSLEPYRLRLHGGALGRLPLHVPPPARIAREPVAARSARIVAIERGATTDLRPLEPLPALSLLHEAAFRAPPVDLGALIGRGRAALLRWHEPGPALDALEGWLAEAPD